MKGFAWVLIPGCCSVQSVLSAVSGEVCASAFSLVQSAVVPVKFVEVLSLLLGGLCLCRLCLPLYVDALFVPQRSMEVPEQSASAVL